MRRLPVKKRLKDGDAARKCDWLSLRTLTGTILPSNGRTFTARESREGINLCRPARDPSLPGKKRCFRDDHLKSHRDLNPFLLPLRTSTAVVLRLPFHSQRDSHEPSRETGHPRPTG